MQKKIFAKADLRQFTSSEYWYRHQLVRKVLYTDGVKFVAEHGSAYWLVDEIALHQKFTKAIATEPFQVWDLGVNNDHTAILTCTDGNEREVYTKKIEFTDFPLGEIRFYFTDNTILLPSEY